MQILLNKTINHHQKINSDKARRGTPLSVDNGKGPLSWKPQVSGLTRDEMRAAVLEMIG